MGSRKSKQAWVPFALVIFVLAGCKREGAFSFKAPFEQIDYREVEVSTVTNVNKPVVKIVLVVDNSFSMEDEQENLAKGTAKLIESVKGLNVDFHVVTTSALDSSTTFESATHQAANLYFGLGVNGEVIPLTQAPTVDSSWNAYLKKNTNQLSPPLSSQSFRDGMAPSAFEQAKAALVSAIVDVGTEGNDSESGLCSMGRVLAEDGASALFKTGDKAAFILISDADDNTDANTCTRELASQKYKRVSTTDTAAPRQVMTSGGADTQWWAYSAKFTGSAGASTPEKYLLTYDWVSSRAYWMEAKYNDKQYKLFWQRHSAAPQYKLFSTHYLPQYKVSYDYDYAGECIRDNQKFACTKNQTVSNASFDPAAAGNPPASSQTCTAGVRTYVQGLLLAGQTLKGCQYTYAAPETTSSEVITDLAAAGNPAPANGQVCTTALVTRARSLVPTGSVYKTCSYTYTETISENSKMFDPARFGNPATGSGNLTCNAALVTEAQAQVTLLNKTYKGCYWTYSAPSVTLPKKNFDPADYAGISMSTTKQDCGAEMRTWAKTNLAVPEAYQSDFTCKFWVDETIAKVLDQAFVASEQGISKPAVTTPIGCGTGTKLFNHAQTLLQASQTGKTVRNCTYRYVAEVPGAAAPVSTCQAPIMDVSASQDLCGGQAFTSGGQNYASLSAYFRANPAKCNRAPLAADSFSACPTARIGYKSVQDPTVTRVSFSVDGPATSRSVAEALLPGAANINQGILSRAAAMFGTSGFFFSSIIHDEDLSTDDCLTGYREGYGKRYRSLVQQLGKAGNAYPICSADYTPALNKIQDFIERVTRSSYQVELKDDEYVDSISIKRGAHRVPAQMGIDYTVRAGTIDFQDLFVQPGDVVVVRIARKYVVDPLKQITK